jgi:lipopolysaccharide transport system permease protein
MADTELEVRAQAPAPEVAIPPPAKRVERVTVVRPAPRWPHLDLRELWQYRELFLRLTWRDVAVRYKQTAFGIGWAIFQPLLTMVVFTLVFGYVGGFASKGLQYQVFSYSALLPWFYFASSVTLGSASLVSNRGLVTKVYFPRVLLPLASVTVPIVDFFFASTVLVALMAWYGIAPSAAVVLAPLFLLMALLTALGVGLFFSAVTVRYRDVAYAIPFLMQSWMFVSGVILPIESFPEYAQWLLSVNPMTAVVNGFQWGVVGAAAPELGQTLVSIAATALFFVVGLWYFRRSEPRFADTI